MTDSMGRAAEAPLTTPAIPLPRPRPKWIDLENFNKARTSDRATDLGLSQGKWLLRRLGVVPVSHSSQPRVTP